MSQPRPDHRAGPAGPGDDRPPFLGTWRRVYAAVLLYLALLITLFWMFTRAYAL